jgi:syntaxin 8
MVSLPPVREPTPPTPSPPPSPRRGALDDGIYRPYKDEPVAYEDDEQTHDGIVLQQRQMMDGTFYLGRSFHVFTDTSCMVEQDTHLDRLSSSIRNQRDISIQINDELDVHTGLLESLDHELDSTQDRLGRARRRLDHVARGAKDNGRFYGLLHQRAV